MPDVNFVLTAAGAVALVNAAHTGTDPLIISQCGVSATALVPNAALTALPDEIKRISTLAGDVVAPDTIHLMVRDESDDVYSLRSLALYTSDGTLFAIYGQAAPIMEKSAGAMLLLALDAQFADVDAALISFGDTDFLNPPATETMQGVAEIATQAEANAGADDQRILTPKKGKAAQLPWLLTQDGSGSGLDADLLDGQHASAFLQAALFTGAQILSRLLTVDGAGTGLDADLLDGQQGSYYSNIPARLGFTPLNSAAYTAADVFAKVLGLDGSGSGLDADLLDGQQGSYYTDIVARLGFKPVEQGTGIGQNSYNQVKIGWSGTRLKTTVDGSDQGNMVFDSHIADVWRASNDGSGSGLDADLLDGLQASAFLQASLFTGAQILSRLLTVDGAGSGLDADLLDGLQGSSYVKYSDFSLTGSWVQFPNGLILQWGFHPTLTNRATTTVTFPRSFPNGVFGMMATLGSAIPLASNGVGLGASQISNSQGQISVQANSAGTTGALYFVFGH